MEFEPLLERDPFIGEPDELYESQNITINHCELKHKDGVLTLGQAVDSFQVAFGLSLDVSKCLVSILDTTNTLANLDPDGTEILTLGWESEKDNPILIEFNIYKIDIQTDDKNQTSKLYNFYGCSPEFIHQATTDINRTMTGKISEMVQTIFDNIGTPPKTAIKNKLYDVHETTGVVNLIIPGETPLEAIRRLEKRSYSAKHKSSLYRFFQDTKGFRWANLERLIEEGRADEFTFKYAYNPSNVNTGKTTKEKFNIINMSFGKTKDIIEKLISGAYASRVNEIDLVNQKIDTTQLQLKENFKDFFHLDQPAITFDKLPIIEQSLNKINNTEWINKYPGNFNWGAQITRAKFYADCLGQVRMNCMVPGYSNLNPGRVLDLSMLEASINKENPEQEKKISGKYLIDTVTHVYSQQKYVCVLSCSKESHRANLEDLSDYIIGDRK